MRFLLGLALLAFAVDRAAAQAPAFRWATGHGGAGEDYGRGVAVDSQGNVYLAGHFTAPAQIGNRSLAGFGGQDVFLAKIDRQGNVLWASSAGGPEFDECGRLAVDAAGNSYLAGSFSGRATFGERVVASKGFSDSFVAKVDAAGRFLWVKTGGGNGNDAAHAVAVDGAGSVYVTGSFEAAAKFGTTTLNAIGSRDVFLVKYDQDGDVVWARTAGGKGTDESWTVAVDSAGQCTIAGEFSGRATFDSIDIQSRGLGDIFIAKHDPLGRLLWVVRAGGDDPRLADAAAGIALDRTGNCYVTGLFHGRSDFGGRTLTAVGYRDLFVMKLDSLGNVLWADRAGGTDGDEAHDIAVDALGNAYVTGFYYGAIGFGNTMLNSPGHADVFVAKYTPRGVLEWVRGAEGTAYASGFAIAVDSQGSCYATGYFRGNTTFGGLPVGYRGDRDVFLFRIDSGPLPPELTIHRAGRAINLLWPTNPPGFILESGSTLSDPKLWRAHTNVTISIQDARQTIGIEASEPAQFFRLRRP